MIKKEQTAKSGHRTHHRQHWTKVQNRGTSTGDPCSYRYTNTLLTESTIQTVYKRNTRRCTIKIYAGTTTRASLARKQEKCKNNITDTPGIKHAPSHACGVRVSAVPVGTYQTGPIYRAVTPKLLNDTQHRPGQRQKVIIVRV